MVKMNWWEREEEMTAKIELYLLDLMTMEYLLWKKLQRGLLRRLLATRSECHRKQQSLSLALNLSSLFHELLIDLLVSDRCTI